MKQLFVLRHSMFVILAIFGLVVMSNTALAHDNDDYYGYQQVSQVAINNGYQLGYGHGSNDRAYGKSYDLRDKTYRDADSGYRGSYGSKDRYKQQFRQGYELGYRDGYSGNRRRGSFNSGGYYNQQPTYNYPQRGRAYGRRYDDRYNDRYNDRYDNIRNNDNGRCNDNRY